MVLKTGLFEKYIRNTWKVFKCGAGEGWKRSVGPLIRKLKKYYTQSRKKGMP
jgi:hypothetical protein